MSWKSSLSKPFAKLVASRLRKIGDRAVYCQERTMRVLIRQAKETAFGRDHKFRHIDSHKDFTDAIPIRDYEALAPYIERAKGHEQNVLWPGRPLYFCKTSGTTSGTKYIPLTHHSLPNHINSARNALLSYIAETGRADFVDGKMIFLQGSPKLEKLESGIPFGRLSGIVANHIPKYLQKNRMPSFETNCISDWETKVNAIAQETLREDMSLISGIPSWVQMYFEMLLKKSGEKNIKKIFPNFNLFVYGGVNYEPYRNKFIQLIGEDIPSIELYPASEGFIAFQDTQESDGLLLNVSSGIFFEFIRVDEFYNENPKRISMADVKVGINYVLILSNNAGLWGYNIGDTVRFVSLEPPRIKVTGRIAHFTSAFGEHVIAEEVERTMSEVCQQQNVRVSEFHVAPQINPQEGLPYHEWLVEFDEVPNNINEFSEALDHKMAEQNVYYNDLVKGHVLKPLVLTVLVRGAFNNYMKSVGKLGGQNKVPRLANDRKIAEELLKS